MMTKPRRVDVTEGAVEIHVSLADQRVSDHFSPISDADERVEEAHRVIRLGVDTASQIGMRSQALSLHDARRELVQEAHSVKQQLADLASETGKACRKELENLRSRSVTDLANAVREATGDDRLASAVADALVGSGSPLKAVESRLADAAAAMEAAHRRGLESAVRQLGDVASHLSRLTGTFEASQTSPARGGTYEGSVENRLAAVVERRGDRLVDVRTVVGHNGSKKGDYVAVLEHPDLRIGIELKDTQVGPSSEAARGLIDGICAARDAHSGMILAATPAAMPTGLRGLPIGLVGDRGVAVCIEAGDDSDILSIGYSLARALAVIEERRQQATRTSSDFNAAIAATESLRRRISGLAESETRLRSVARETSAESKRIGKLMREALAELDTIAEELARDTKAA